MQYSEDLEQSYILKFKELYFHFFSKSPKLTAHCWHSCEAYIEKIEIKKGHSVIRAGDVVLDFIIVGGGFYKTFYNEGGVEHIKSFHSKYDIITPITELKCSGVSSVTIECLKEGFCYKIEWDKLNMLFQKDPFIKEVFNDLVIRQYLELSDSFKDLVTLSTHERLEKLRREKPDILANITQKNVANFLGITPVALSRLISTGKTSA
jgi:hypothetical protein